jgi:hypothetical protein
VVGVELGDDIVRGLLVPADRQTAVANALRLVHAESALGLWVEPGVQRFFEQSHGVGNVVLTWLLRLLRSPSVPTVPIRYASRGSLQ